MKFAVIFDAGSTGSRVHAYKFRVGPGSSVDLLDDVFVQRKPGLSAYGGNPKDAAASLKPLLEAAVNAFPLHLRGTTSAELRATAGLRLLPGKQALDILDAVLQVLKASPFLVRQDSVSVLEGQDEGAYAWLTLNYLLGKLGRDPKDTAIAIDLGGGSVQVSYAITAEDARAAPVGYVKRLAGAGRQYDVYVHSYLRFGLMAARGEILRGTQPDGGSPCVAKGFSGIYTYRDETYAVRPIEGVNGTGLDCRNAVSSVLGVGQPCKAPSQQCSFNGAWGGPGITRDQPFYLFSYFWDRALDSSIIDLENDMGWETSPSDFVKKSNLICNMDVEQLNKSFPQVPSDQLPYLCMDLSFCSALLTQGVGVAEDQMVSLVKQIRKGEQTFEMSWTLGAAINSIASSGR